MLPDLPPALRGIMPKSKKEALAITSACEKFLDYILGDRFQIESDHKPLIALLNTKQMDNVPPPCPSVPTETDVV